MKGNYIVLRNSLLLLGINVFVRGIWLLLWHPYPHFDFLWYFVHAIGIAKGYGYLANGLPTAYWPIGYPLFLAAFIKLFGVHYIPLEMINACLSSGIVLLIYLLCIRFFPESKIPFVAALAYSFLPSQIEWNATLGSEELYTFLLLVSFYVLLVVASKRNWLPAFIAGILLGFACDVRPIALLFPAFYMAMVGWSHRKQGKKAILFIKSKLLPYTLGMILAVSPVTIRNEIVLHHFIPVSTNGGIVLWQGTHVDTGYYWTWHPASNPLLAAGTNEVLENQIGEQQFFDHIIHHPFLDFFHGFAKWYYLYNRDDNVLFDVFYGTPYLYGEIMLILSYLNNFYYYVFMLFAILGIWKARKWGFHGQNPLLYYVVYNTLIFFVFPAWDRFHYPMMPVLAIYVAIGIVALHRKMKSRPEKY